jgi:hypothetical protein
LQSKGTMQGVSVKCCCSQMMLRSEYAQLHSLAGGMSVVNYHMASLGEQNQSFLVLLRECVVHGVMY